MTDDILRKKIEDSAAASGITGIGEVNIGELEYRDDIRKICEGNSCRSYGTCWACPPAVGTLEECRQRCEQYERMFVFSRVYSLSGPFDMKGMMEAMKDFKKVTEAFDKALGEEASPRMLLSNEGCGRCSECTYPDEPCRFPDRLYHSIEGYGFLVYELAKKAGLEYNNGQNTVTYFGALLCGEKR